VSDTEGVAFHLLMADADPVHLVGPFTDQRTACLWGLMNERRSGALDGRSLAGSPCSDQHVVADAGPSQYHELARTAA